METYQGAFFIIAVLGMVLFILAAKTQSHMIINIALRGISGSILIFAINCWMKMEGYPYSVGLNPVTFLTSTILGFPGVALLFGIKICSLL